MVNSFFIFSEVNAWNMQVLSIYCMYSILCVSELIQNCFMLFTTNDIGCIWRSRCNFSSIVQRTKNDSGYKDSKFGGSVMCEVKEEKHAKDSCRQKKDRKSKTKWAGWSYWRQGNLIGMWYGGALVIGGTHIGRQNCWWVIVLMTVFSRKYKTMKICKYFPTNCANLSSEIIFSVFSNLTLVEIYKPRNFVPLAESMWKWTCHHKYAFQWWFLSIYYTRAEASVRLIRH
jgi:hypothetical protein